MNKTTNFLIKSMLALVVAFTAGMASADAADAKAGTVTFTTGDANIVHEDKSIVKAAKNDAVNVGDTIETKTGRLQLSLIDGGKVSLQPNTVYKINKYEFSGKEDGSEYAFTELLKGGMRTISGLIGHKNRDRYQLKTAVATIGIRGTEFTVNFNDNQLLMTTNQGSVDVCTLGGCLNAMSGQSISVAGLGASPKPSSKAAKAAAAPPGSNRAVFTAGEDSIEIKVPVAVVPEPTPVETLASYNGDGNLLSLINTDNNVLFDVAVPANIQTSADSSPKLLQVTTIDSIEILPTDFNSINSDGIIGWGRYEGGTITTSTVVNGGGKQNTFDNVALGDYVIGKTPEASQLANLTGTYSVFGSTAPIMVNAAGVSTPIGAENAVTGNLTFSFATTNFKYGINVNTNIENFTISGNGNLVAGNSIFYGASSQTSIVSQGSTCNFDNCSGALQGNSSVIQGAFFGPNGERIGLQYGLYVIGSGNNGNGNGGNTVNQIYGTAVLK